MPGTTIEEDESFLTAVASMAGPRPAVEGLTGSGAVQAVAETIGTFRAAVGSNAFGIEGVTKHVADVIAELLEVFPDATVPYADNDTEDGEPYVEMCITLPFGGTGPIGMLFSASLIAAPQELIDFMAEELEEDDPKMEKQVAYNLTVTPAPGDTTVASVDAAKLLTDWFWRKKKIIERTARRDRMVELGAPDVIIQHMQDHLDKA